MRRLEGVQLHPTTDERGVHYFEPEEVEAVARGESGSESGIGDDSTAEPPYDDGDREAYLQRRDYAAERQAQQEQLVQAVRETVAREVEQQLARVEREQLASQLRKTIEEGMGVLDAKDLDGLWGVLDELDAG